MGIERILLLMEKQGAEFLPEKELDLYIAPMDESAVTKAMQLAKEAREAGYTVEYDLMERGLKAQMKYADKKGAAFTMVLGENELNSGTAKLKNMQTGEQTEISIEDKFFEMFENVMLNSMFSGVLEEK